MVEKKTINKKYTYALAVGFATFFGAILLILFAVKPLYEKSKLITAEVKAKQTEYEKLQDKKEKLDLLKDKEEQLKKDAKKVEAALPTTDEVGRLFIQMDKIATGTGGSVKSMSQSGTADTTTTEITEGINLITYTVPAEFSDYFKMKDFLVKTEKALRLVNLSGVVVNATDEGSISTTFTTNTYVRK